MTASWLNLYSFDFKPSEKYLSWKQNLLPELFNVPFSCPFFENVCFPDDLKLAEFSPSANPTKWSNTLKTIRR